MNNVAVHIDHMSRRWDFFHCFQLEYVFIYYIGEDKSKDEASLLGRQSYLLEEESDKAKAAGFYLVLLLCRPVASGLNMLRKILIPIFMTSVIGETEKNTISIIYSI